VSAVADMMQLLEINRVINRRRLVSAVADLPSAVVEKS
jgi:hypothetical protein